MRMKWEYTLSDSSDQEEDQIALPAALAGSGQLDRLVETARSDARQALSENTLRAYAKDWSHFARWCRMRGADPMPPVQRQPSWPVPTTTLAGGAERKTGMPVWRAAPPA